MELNKILDRDLARLEKEALLRSTELSEHIGAVRILRNGREYTSFSCNDYLGLTHNAEVIRAAIEATQKYGAGGAASRLVTGNHPLYEELELLLSELKHTEAACVFGSGYLANLGTITALAGEGDIVIVDKLAHASIIDGARYSSAKFKRFAHNDLEHCKTLLNKYRKHYRNCLIVTDTVFSMDGDVAPIDRLSELAGKYNSWLMTDDAHGLGVIQHSFCRSADIQMGTLSKAVGVYGGYVCGSKKLVEYLKNKARTLIYSTALPPAVLASAIASLKIIKRDKETGRKLTLLPLQKARLFVNMLGYGAIAEPQSPIVPLVVGSAERALKASSLLEKRGYIVTAIRPPTVPKNRARLRFTFCTEHSDDEIKELASVVKNILNDL